MLEQRIGDPDRLDHRGRAAANLGRHQGAALDIRAQHFQLALWIAQGDPPGYL